MAPGAGLYPKEGCRFVFCAGPAERQRRATPDERPFESATGQSAIAWYETHFSAARCRSTARLSKEEETMNTIIDRYREADEEERLNLFLSYRDLRNDFIAIQLQEYQGKKRKAAQLQFRPIDAYTSLVSRLRRSFT
jgi:hypothetical protein